MATRQTPALPASHAAPRTGAALHVCVIGAGLAGLACAVAAASQGARVELLDERTALSAHPTHVNVVPNLLRDLVTLGVAADCVRAGFPYRGIRVMDASGRICFEMPTPRLAPSGYPEALGMAHGDLTDILARAALERGVDLQLRTGVETLTWRQGQSVLQLTDGSERVPDLTVLATGARSALRAAVPGHCPAPVRLGPDWIYAQLPRPRDVDHAMLVLDSGGQHAFVVPISLSTVGIALTRGDDTRPVPPVLHSLLAHLTPAIPRIERPLLAALMPSPWHRGTLVCVGECAHALPPHFGQSAAQAIEDAVVLQELLMQGLAPTALAQRFSERRHARAGQVYDLVTDAARSQVSPNEATDLHDLYHRLSSLVAEPA